MNENMADRQPYSLTSDEASITVYPIIQHENVNASFRVTAPSGFEWDTDPASFEDTTNVTTENHFQIRGQSRTTIN